MAAILQMIVMINAPVAKVRHADFFDILDGVSSVVY